LGAIPGGQLFALIDKENLLMAPRMRITYFKETSSARYCFPDWQMNPLCLVLPPYWVVSDRLKLIQIGDNSIIVEITLGQWPQYQLLDEASVNCIYSSEPKPF
jgi:hypothetical protein